MSDSLSAWKSWCLPLLAGISLLGIMLLPPIYQDPTYHQFVDSRRYFAIPNFCNVLSNSAFLLAGGIGLFICRIRPDLPFRLEWTVTFTGITLVSFGSAYYHWQPNNGSLLWDRLPMTIAFMGLLAAVLADYLDPHTGRAVLLPALALGLISVVYWRVSGDLRLYVWVQFAPLLLIAAALLLYRSRYSHQCLLLTAFAFYILAKFAEALDNQIYAACGQIVSGHSLKHLLAAAGCYCLTMLVDRRKLKAEM